MSRHHAPSVSIAVIKDGAIEWARAYGVASNVSTLLQAASLAKPVAAMAALHMAQYGNFGLDQDVNETLTSWKVPGNEFTRERKVTVRGILSHTAGLTVHGFRGYAEGEAVPDVLAILNGAKPANNDPIRVDTTPGTAYRYSGGGYVVLQLLLSERLQRPFPELMQRIVLQRVGMRDSTFEQPLPAERARRTAVAFHENGRSYTGGWHTYPEMAAAGLWTTPTDLCKFAVEVSMAARGLSNKVIEQTMARAMITPHVGRYGLGFVSESETFQHSGSNAGYRCRLVCTHEARHGAAIMTNSDNGGNLIGVILDAIAKESQWSV
jgi:CubicO group peptidase (beta-lactamase class C family)